MIMVGQGNLQPPVVPVEIESSTSTIPVSIESPTTVPTEIESVASGVTVPVSIESPTTLSVEIAPPSVVVGGAFASFYPSQNIAPNTSVSGTITTPSEMVTDWMVLVRGGVGASGTIPLTPGYPTNANAAVQDNINIVSASTGQGLGSATINQQLYFIPGFNNNNGGQAGLFYVLPFIPNANITLKTTWNTTLTDDLPMESTSLFLVNKIYPYIPVLPSFAQPVTDYTFSANETMYMVYGSNMYPYDWITVNVDNINNSSDLSVAIYTSNTGYGLGTELMPSTTLENGNNYFSVRMADSGLTSYIATPQIIVAVTSSVAQSVILSCYAYPDLSKPLLYI